MVPCNCSFSSCTTSEAFEHGTIENKLTRLPFSFSHYMGEGDWHSGPLAVCVLGY